MTYGGRMRRLFLTWLATAAVLVSVAAPAGAAGNAQGVTANQIKLGIAYPNLAEVRQLSGVSVDQGSFTDAFNAVIAQINAQGGVNGRKIVPVYAAVTPIGTAPAAQACTTLTEDNQVFAVVSTYTSLSPICYIQTHHTAMVQGVLQAAAPPGSAPNFTLAPPLSSFDPRLIAAFKHTGAFKGQKVAVFATAADQAEMQDFVLPALKAQGVKVLQTAIDNASPSDVAAVDQQVAIAAAKFQSLGATEVVAVGTGSAVWPQGLQANQGSYAPRLLATNGTAISGYVDTPAADPHYFKGLLSGTPTMSSAAAWEQPAMKKCVATIKQAYPNDVIADPSTATGSTPTTWIASIRACQDIPLFTQLVTAAGTTLNNQTFARGGESLRNISLPGVNGAVSFGPGQQYATGPIYLITYDAATKTALTSSQPAPV